MNPHLKLREPRSLALAAALVLSISSLGSSAGLASDERATAAVAGDFAPNADGQSAGSPATFFTINEVLAKLDRRRARGGPNAVQLAALAPASTTATDAQPEQSAVPSLGSEPFGLITFRAPDGALSKKWRGVEADIAREKLVLDGCRDKPESCPSHAAQFLRLIKAVKSKSGRAQLEEANQGLNTAIRYVSDLAQFGELDRWSAPLATFATGKGDCEDYAIAKYVALSEAGFSRDDLRLVLVRDRAVRQDHAVLAARLDGHWLILDNRWSALQEDSASLSFTPLFAIDHRGVQLFAAPYAKRGPLDGELEAAPAAAGDRVAGEWTGEDNSSDVPSARGALPLWM